MIVPPTRLAAGDADGAGAELNPALGTRAE